MFGLRESEDWIKLKKIIFSIQVSSGVARIVRRGGGVHLNTQSPLQRACPSFIDYCNDYCAKILKKSFVAIISWINPMTSPIIDPSCRISFVWLFIKKISRKCFSRHMLCLCLEHGNKHIFTFERICYFIKHIRHPRPSPPQLALK